jgi:ferredoxin-NADP reductase
MDEWTVEVLEVRSVGDSAIALELETPGDFHALPGQFVRVFGRDGDESIARYYTLSSPDVTDSFEITVAVDPAGDLSPWLADRAPGDAIRIEGPFGDVAYDDEGNVLVLAGGPGVGPALGIGERAIDRGYAATIVYRDEAPMHDDRLSALSDGGAAVRILAPDDDVEPALPEALDTEETTVYVFGFRDFVDAARDALASIGVDPDEVHVESFG